MIPRTLSCQCLAASGAASSSRRLQPHPLPAGRVASPPPGRRVHRGAQTWACHLSQPRGLAASGAASSSRQADRAADVGPRAASPPPGRRVHRGCLWHQGARRDPPPRRLRGGEFIEARRERPPRQHVRASPPPGRRVHRGMSPTRTSAAATGLAASGAASSSRPGAEGADWQSYRPRRLRGGEFIEASWLPVFRRGWWGLAASGAASSSRRRAAPTASRSRRASPPPGRRVHRGAKAGVRVGSALFASPPPGRRVHRGLRAINGLGEKCNASPPPGRRVHRGGQPATWERRNPRLAASGAASSSRQLRTGPHPGNRRAAPPPPGRRVHRGEKHDHDQRDGAAASPPPGRRVHRGEGTIESACWWWRLAASGAASSSRHVPAAGDAPALFGLAASGAASSSRPLACLRCAAPLAPHR